MQNVFEDGSVGRIEPFDADLMFERLEAMANAKEVEGKKLAHIRVFTMHEARTKSREQKFNSKHPGKMFHARRR